MGGDVLNSGIFTGIVAHHRLEPTDYRFDYPVDFYVIDLDELPALDAGVVGFGYNRVRPVAIHDRDYLAGDDRPIAEKIRERFRAAGCPTPLERVTLVTAARWWHYVFNPVSFYFGQRADGRPVCALAEVNNTFGDRHLYVLPALLPGVREGVVEATQDKVFHVSPFNDMHGRYRFSFQVEPNRLNIAVDLEREGRCVFRSHLSGRGRTLSAATLWGTVVRHPLRASLTMPRIVTQAARLHFRRGLPVYPRPEPSHPLTVVRRQPRRHERWARDLVLNRLRRIREGALQIELPDGSRMRCGAEDGPASILHIQRYECFVRIVRGGDIGLGEAFTAGDFTCDDLTRVIELLIANREALAEGNFVTDALGRLHDRVRHVLRPNTRTRGRHNIRAHYDLSNAFFQTFLDESMLYSCARFEQPGDTLAAAQQRKLADLVTKARIGPEHHVLEIGSGWGGFAIEAARRTGCRVTSITISEEQHQLATERVRAAGLSDRVEIRFCDYRDVQGTFDRIVSIEMLEAVGHRYLPSFFAACERLLAPRGMVVLQVITIPDHRYEAYRRGCDWIQKHIFPGGHLPSLNAMSAAMTRVSRLHVEALEDIGTHYAPTLHAWREAFMNNVETVRKLGFDDVFVRKWAYYFAYCEAAFRTRTLNVLQLVLTRPNNASLDGTGGARHVG
jgi:cyclopropane-fatty-acyl-phospholipid synthase